MVLGNEDIEEVEVDEFITSLNKFNEIKDNLFELLTNLDISIDEEIVENICLEFIDTVKTNSANNEEYDIFTSAMSMSGLVEYCEEHRIFEDKKLTENQKHAQELNKTINDAYKSLSKNDQDLWKKYGQYLTILQKQNTSGKSTSSNGLSLFKAAYRADKKIPVFPMDKFQAATKDVLRLRESGIIGDIKSRGRGRGRPKKEL